MSTLLGPSEIRALAAELDLRPRKSLGQNFVTDANTIGRIVRSADLRPDDVVLEVGPGLGSLTLGLLPAAAAVTAVEIDPALAERLPRTVAEKAPELAHRLTVLAADAQRLLELPGTPPTALVANLPYNVAVPVLLHCLAQFPTLRTALVLVQAEVADRLAAGPGSKIYGVPSVKAAWFGTTRRVGTVGPSVFWPVPHVDSGLVRLDRIVRPPHVEPPARHDHDDRPEAAPTGPEPSREHVFEIIDAAFAQRRKTLRAGMAGWYGSAALAESRLHAAGIDPGARAETLGVDAFIALAAAD